MVNALCEVSEFPRNAFHQVMVNMEYEASPDMKVDLHSNTCMEQFALRPTDRYGYKFVQVFEPSVLNELALLEGCCLSDLEQLAIGKNAALNQLRKEIAEIGAKSVLEAVNLASVLISISRFSLALRIIDDIPTEKLTTRDRFEIAMLHFVIQNRHGNPSGMEKTLAAMKSCSEAGGVPDGRILNAACQAVVWYMKSKAISKELFNWYVTQGVKLAKRTHSESPEYIDSASLSAWYRAVAMVPAAKGDGLQTRDYMKKAKATAITAIECSKNVYEQHLLKAYYESTMKEYMYVAKDFKKAEEIATALIELDPVWSISYGELADVYQKFGHLYKAAELYEKAGRMGPPYVGHHLFSAAMLWEQLGKPERALSICLTLFQLSPDNPSVVTAALKLGKKLQDRSLGHFEAAYHQLRSGMRQEHLEYLSSN